MSWLSSCTSGGCGAKMDPAALSAALRGLPQGEDPALLVGFGGADDAAAYRLSEERALLSTVDFFPPMVEDPFTFGSIAAANALSDIYAMGGRPLFALNLVCWPQGMPTEDLRQMLAGGAGKVAEAGAVVAGGHSIYDHEPKYGLAVTGEAHPGALWRNDTPRPGDALLLTKPLGAGLVLSAQRAGEAAEGDVTAALASMQRLNRAAAEVLSRYSVSACTDVTGFGLVAHACEMAGETHTLLVDTASLPVLPGALDYARGYMATAAGQRNRNATVSRADVSAADAAWQELVFDPQTSGGLLASLPAEEAGEALDALLQNGVEAALIGQVVPRAEKAVILV